MAMSQQLDVCTIDGVRFGKELREKEFLFEPGFLNMNHGSFGTYPRAVREKMRSFQDAAEARPDVFIRYEYPILLDESREGMAKLLNVPCETVVFVPNATTGVNTVLRNLTFNSGDHILYFSTIYGACEKTVAYITETTPASSVKIEYTYPVEDDWLVNEFKNRVKQVESNGGKVKIAIFDTVVSMPGVRMPFERLTTACKELSIMSCIDGAHGVGHVKLDLAALDPDFFISNCHKWLHVPRGCAVFYVPTRHHPLMRSTLPTSHGFHPLSGKITGTPLPSQTLVPGKKTAFAANFEFVGTIDNAPYLCIPAALAWRERLGGEAVIREYCTALAQRGAKAIAKYLGTEVMENGTGTLGQACMANVRLPIVVDKVRGVARKAGVEEGDLGAVVRDWMMKVSVDEYGTFLQCLFYDGVWWARLSAQVYLGMEDFEWAGRTLGTICERVEGGEWVGRGSKL